MSRAGETITLVMSGVLHGAVLWAVLLLGAPGDATLLRFMPVELVDPAPAQVPAEPPPVQPRQEAVRPVARPPVAIRRPPPPQPEPPSEARPVEAPAVAMVEAPATPPALPSPPLPAREVPPPTASDASSASTGISFASTGTPDASSPPPAIGQAWPNGRESSGPAVAAVPPTAPADGPMSHAARPRGEYQLRPSYPEAARRVKAEGTTLLRVHITTEGKVDDVQVERSAGHAALDRAATEAIRKWRFEPARRGSAAVATWVVIPVEFRLTDF